MNTNTRFRQLIDKMNLGTLTDSEKKELEKLSSGIGKMPGYQYMGETQNMKGLSPLSAKFKKLNNPSSNLANQPIKAHSYEDIGKMPDYHMLEETPPDMTLRVPAMGLDGKMTTQEVPKNEYNITDDFSNEDFMSSEGGTGYFDADQRTIGGGQGGNQKMIGRGRNLMNQKDGVDENGFPITRSGFLRDTLGLAHVLTSKPVKQDLPTFRESYVDPASSSMPGMQQQKTAVNTNLRNSINRIGGSADPTMNAQAALTAQSQADNAMNQLNTQNAQFLEQDYNRQLREQAANDMRRTEYDNSITQFKNKAAQAEADRKDKIKGMAADWTHSLLHKGQNVEDRKANQAAYDQYQNALNEDKIMEKRRSFQDYGQRARENLNRMRELENSMIKEGVSVEAALGKSKSEIMTEIESGKDPSISLDPSLTPEQKATAQSYLETLKQRAKLAKEKKALLEPEDRTEEFQRRWKSAPMNQGPFNSTIPIYKKGGEFTKFI